MKIRILSDLHLEFGFIDLPVMADETQQVLVLAGDIGLAASANSYLPFIEEVKDRFQDVIYIMGNHEYYGTSIIRGLDKIKERIKFEMDAPNVHVLDNQVLRIGNVSFVCSTLWASYDNNDALCIYYANLQMSDHKKIRTGPKSEPYQQKFKAHHAASLHMKNKQWLFENIKVEKEKGQTVVVVTHHAPSVLSIDDAFKTGPFAQLNGAYASSLENDIFETKPSLMIHGHTHVSFDYELEDELAGDGWKTRIVCNPRGYKGVEENPNFNPELVIDI